MEEHQVIQEPQQVIPESKKSSKLVVIISILVIALVLTGSVSAWFLLKKAEETKSDEGGQESEASDDESEAEGSSNIQSTRSSEFWIYERYLGNWESVEEVEGRPEVTSSGPYDCIWEHYNDFSECYIESNGFKLTQRDDNYTVTQNEAVIWNRNIPSGPCNSVTGFKALGDEFMLDYLSLEGPNSIVVSNDETLQDILDAKDYDKAFAPYSVMGKMTYIAEQDGKQFVVYDGAELGEKYDEIYYACCCGGVIYTIRGDGEIIDFFARKGEDWYYVRGGKKESVEP